MPRYIEKCYCCNSEYEISYQYIDKDMIHDEEIDNDEIYSDDTDVAEPRYCPFCGEEM